MTLDRAISFASSWAARRHFLGPFDGVFEVWGEVYLPEIMHGEAMTALIEGNLVLQRFEAH
jgi:hypothetical protein